MPNTTNLAATLTGIAAVRPSALPLVEQLTLSVALAEWRRVLYRRVTGAQYRELVIRHTRVIADPGSCA